VGSTPSAVSPRFKEPFADTTIRDELKFFRSIEATQVRPGAMRRIDTNGWMTREGTAGK
jgi:hypothetical protein